MERSAGIWVRAERCAGVKLVGVLGRDSHGLLHRQMRGAFSFPCVWGHVNETAADGTGRLCFRRSGECSSVFQSWEAEAWKMVRKNGMTP